MTSKDAILIKRVSKTSKGKEKMLETMGDDEKPNIDEKTLMSIQPCLLNKVFREVMHENIATNL